MRGTLRRMLAILGLVGLLAVCLHAPLAWAQGVSNLDVTQLNDELTKLGRSQQEQFKEVADQLRCPTCTGLSVLQSDAAFSLQIRSAVMDQIKQGKKNDDILQFFTERYGLWILREPPKEGVHLFAWLIPLCLMVLGPLALWLFVWRRPQQLSTFGQRPTADILAQMERELAALRAQQGGAS